MPTRRELIAGATTTPFVTPIAGAAITPSARDWLPRLVLTGDMGVVGERLGFLKDEYEVVGIDRQRGSHEDLNVRGIRWRARIIPGCTVVHLAWEIIWKNAEAWTLPYQLRSLEALNNLLEACRAVGIGRLVFCSSVSVTKEPRPNAVIYAAAKLFAERAVESFYVETGIKTSWLRLGAVNPISEEPRSGMSDSDIESAFRKALKTEGLTTV